MLENFVVHRKDALAESSLRYGAAITVPFSVSPLAVTRVGNSSLLRFFEFSSFPVQTIGLRSFTETVDYQDDFKTRHRK